MKIIAAESELISIPFNDGGLGEGLTPATWNRLEMMLVRIETEDGLVGWGEGFGYFCGAAVKAMFDRTVAPMLIGLDAGDPPAISDMLQRRLALFGRYGITIFALSGVDLALWDLKGKREGKSLSALLTDTPAQTVAAYASLVRYADPDTARKYTARARAEGFDYIKLHELTKDEIAPCHEVLDGAELMVDVNCSWSAETARSMMAWLAGIGVKWLEEPTFPPEDVETLSALARTNPDVALSAGENLCTSWQFKTLIESGAVLYPQPSVTKVGGVSEFIKIMALAKARNMPLMPHSPYFGPGYLATLHLCAALPDPVVFEYLYVWPEAYLFSGMPLPEKGRITVPSSPGLGFEPDPDVIARYRTAL